MSAKPWIIGLSIMVSLIIVQTCAAQSYYYEAACNDSYSKQGDDTADLTVVKGRPFNCDAFIISFLKNGNTLIQFVEKKSSLTPLGFAGGALDSDLNPNMVILHIDRVYLQHKANPSNPEAIGGVEGFCFLDGKLNIRSLKEISCTSKIELGTEKLIYSVKARVTRIGERVPGS